MPDRIVPHFQEELEQLKTRLLEMGGLAEDRVRSAVRGLVQRDAPVIDRVLAGDAAINIAEAVRRYMRHPPVKELIDIPRMADIAQRMLRNALDAFVRRDITLAQQVLDADDALDALKTQVFRELLTYMLQDPHKIEPALDLI